MADAYWRYSSDARQPPPASSLVVKRPRTDYDVPSGHELSAYYPREDERVAPRVIRDTDSINASYDRYLRSGQMSTYAGGESGRLGISNHSVDDPRITSDSRISGELRMGSDRRIGGDPRMGSDPRIGGDPRITSGGAMDLPVKNRSSLIGSGRPEISLPPDASSTLFVEGLPANCTRREVAHIFRPFVGYKEVRLVTKEARRSGGDPLVLSFVDFASPAHAATAMDALQGYKFDEHDPDSAILRLQFARYPGARSTGGHRGRR